MLLHTHTKRYFHDLSLLEQYYQEGEILEVGSSPYHLTYLLQQKGYPVTGLDILPERQQAFLDRTQLKIIQNNVETEPLPFPDNSFHYIIFNEIFEHLRINPIQTLREVNRVLHPDGYLALSTPNLYAVRNIVLFLLGRGFDDPYEEFKKLETIQHMGHVREYTVKQVRKFLTETGFQSEAVLLRSFIPMSGTWRLFNGLRKIVPGINEFQIHIARKA